MGTFDGVHRGHQEIIRQLTTGAHDAGLPAVVLTFDPHPVAVLRPEKAPLSLTSADERAHIFEKLGVDFAITHRFDAEVAALPAKSFLARLKKHLGFSQFWVGYDFAMGRDRDGNIPALYELEKTFDYTLHVVDPIVFQGTKVSSSQIRTLLSEGRVEEAGDLLGRPYQLSGDVIEGAKRGRTIGIPTANLEIHPRRAIPARGVYACQATVNHSRVDAVTNIGVRPTFENGPVRISVEAHLLDFSGDLYGQVIELAFLARLREERKFSGVDALVAQIQTDITQARELFDKVKV
ncbi:MAG: bifunctional riboflavin kinase/FAD synthetase [Anaerolineae bacterium]|nr:bifunctional riboflavin kinase/FAD synthetase [Anaerolineae bacterium]